MDSKAFLWVCISVLGLVPTVPAAKQSRGKIFFPSCLTPAEGGVLKSGGACQLLRMRPPWQPHPEIRPLTDKSSRTYANTIWKICIANSVLHLLRVTYLLFPTKGADELSINKYWLPEHIISLKWWWWWTWTVTTSMHVGNTSFTFKWVLLYRAATDCPRGLKYELYLCIRYHLGNKTEHASSVYPA